MMIDNRPVLCINHQAYSYREVNMIAVQDVINDFFPTATLSEAIEVFQNVLSVTVYRANWYVIDNIWFHKMYLV